MFQPTHPHGVRRLYAEARLIILYVPTHAPARGATFGPIDREAPRYVPTHAPARGATRQTPSWSRQGLCSNPRTRTGCDVRELLA